MWDTAKHNPRTRVQHTLEFSDEFESDPGRSTVRRLLERSKFLTGSDTACITHARACAGFRNARAPTPLSPCASRIMRSHDPRHSGRFGERNNGRSVI